MLSSISGLGETGPEQEWFKGTEFSSYSDFPEFWANLARYTQNFKIIFRKMSAPFDPPTGISGIFGGMESAPVFTPASERSMRAVRELCTCLRDQLTVRDAFSSSAYFHC